MRSFKFNVGDLLRCNDKDGWISPVGCPDRHYTDSLRVEFRFWDGAGNVYVVTAEDGIGMFLLEDAAELQEKAADAVVPEEKDREVDPGPAVEETYSLTRGEMLDLAGKMTFDLDDRLVPLSRERLRSEAWLSGFVFAKAHR